MDERITHLQEVYNNAEIEEETAKKARYAVGEEIADKLMDKYAEDIMDLKSVFAFGANMLKVSETKGVTIRLNIEPGVEFEQVKSDYRGWKQNLKSELENNIIEEDIEIRLTIDWEKSIDEV